MLYIGLRSALLPRSVTVGRDFQNGINISLSISLFRTRIFQNIAKFHSYILNLYTQNGLTIPILGSMIIGKENMREIKMKIRNISYLAVTCFLTVGLFIMMAVPLYEVVSYGGVISENDYSLARGVSLVFSGQEYSSVKIFLQVSAIIDILSATALAISLFWFYFYLGKDLRKFCVKRIMICLGVMLFYWAKGVFGILILGKEDIIITSRAYLPFVISSVIVVALVLWEKALIRTGKVSEKNKNVKETPVKFTSENERILAAYKTLFESGKIGREEYEEREKELLKETINEESKGGE